MIRQGAWIEINKEILKQNLQTLKNYFEKTSPVPEIMPTIKANAYGHGLQECADLFVQEGVSRLGVACINEAYELRTFGSALVQKASVVVLTPPLKEEAEWFCRLQVEFVATDIEVVKKLSVVAQQNNIHLNAHLYIDTGMHRDGIEPSVALTFMRECKKFENISIVGLCTHLATSDEANHDFAVIQLHKFREVQIQLRNAGYLFRYVHAANSGANIQFPNSHFSLVRPGLILYGYLPNNNLEQKLTVYPALSLKTRIVSLRRISAGESVGYKRQYYSKQDTTIATIPIGYGDGFSRRYSERFSCIIRGKRYPGVGFICMDQCMIDIGDDLAALGDEVVLIGTQGGETINANDIASLGGTISYEVLTALSSRIPRIFVSPTGR